MPLLAKQAPKTVKANLVKPVTALVKCGCSKACSRYNKPVQIVMVKAPSSVTLVVNVVVKVGVKRIANLTSRFQPELIKVIASVYRVKAK